MYKVTFTRSAAKALIKIPRNVAKTVRAKIDQLARDPYAPNNNIKALIGTDGYRLRVGDWRVIYQVNDGVLEILVVKIATRGEVYK